jgi:hypothetical protein
MVLQLDPEGFRDDDSLTGCSLGHAIGLITARQNAPAGAEDDNSAGIAVGSGIVELPRRSQVVVACDDALDSSADASGRA